MNDGGPAYPVHHATDACLGYSGIGFPAKDMLGNQVWVNSGAPGMSLRDWFAGMALSGWIASGYGGNQGHLFELGEPEVLASNSYQCADAMLTERERGRTDGKE